MQEKENVIIRKAHYADIAPMTELLGDLFSIEKDFSFKPALHSEGLKLLFAKPDSLILVAKQKNSVIGMITLQQLISSAEGGYVGVVEDFVIDSNFRSKGIGIRLLDELFDWAAQNGLKRIQLAADKHNETALNFYAKNGFKHSSMTMLYRKGSIND